MHPSAAISGLSQQFSQDQLTDSQSVLLNMTLIPAYQDQLDKISARSMGTNSYTVAGTSWTLARLVNAVDETMHTNNSHMTSYHISVKYIMLD